MKRSSLLVVGSSGSGKTTAVNSVRASRYESDLVIPKRFITRPQRLGDDTVENTHVTHEVFNKGVEEHLIFPHWSRDLGGDLNEHYGFERLADNDDRLHVYSANNAFMRERNFSTEEILESGLVVLVYATREVREQRLFGRSPDIAQVERDKRLSDNAEDILTIAGVEVIDTTLLQPSQTAEQFQKLVAGVLASN